MWVLKVQEREDTKSLVLCPWGGPRRGKANASGKKEKFFSPKGQRTHGGGGIYIETLSQTNCQIQGRAVELKDRLQAVLFSRKSSVSFPATPFAAPLLSPSPTQLNLPLAPGKTWFMVKLNLVCFQLEEIKTVLTKDFGYLPTHREPLRGLGRNSIDWTSVRMSACNSLICFHTGLNAISALPRTLTTTFC